MSDLFETGLNGRRKIYTATDEITAENVIGEVTRAMRLHLVNAREEDVLYWYRRGIQPILNRTKERNNFVCNKIVINFADQAVTFRNGYFLTKPATYIGRTNADTDDVDKFNGFVRNSGKHKADNKVVDWFHTVGVGVLYIEPSRDLNPIKPFKCYALDPRCAFVVYSLKAGNKPKYAVNYVIQEDNYALFDVFTKDYVFRIKGSMTDAKAINGNPNPVQAIPMQLLGVEPNIVGQIPIIEYYSNENRTACFEMAIPAMNEYNNVESDRADGVEQFIQSLLVLRGVDVEDGVDAEYIKQNGMLCLPFVNDKLPEVSILAEQLDQTATQTTLTSLETQIRYMCGMPSSLSAGGQSYENNGAAYMDRGYAICDTINRNTIDCWSDSNDRATKVMLAILARRGFAIDMTELDLNFPPNEIDNLLVRTQSAVNLKQIGLAPELVLTKSGLSHDPITDVKLSKDYMTTAFSQKVEENTTNVNEVVERV